MLATFSSKGEMLRLSYPNHDNRQYLKYFHKKPSKWTRITKYGDAPVYALTSEVAAGDPNFGKAKFSFWLPKGDY